MRRRRTLLLTYLLCYSFAPSKGSPTVGLYLVQDLVGAGVLQIEGIGSDSFASIGGGLGVRNWLRSMGQKLDLPLCYRLKDMRIAFVARACSIVTGRGSRGFWSDGGFSSCLAC